MKNIFGFLLVLVFCAAGFGQAKKTITQVSKQTVQTNQSSIEEETIAKLEKEYTQAFIKGDEKALGRLISDDYQSTNSKGDLLGMTKQSIIQAVKSGGVKYLAYKTYELNINIEGNIAIVKGKLSKHLAKNNVMGFVAGEYIRTWTKKDNAWQITRYQAVNSAKNTQQF